MPNPIKGEGVKIVIDDKLYPLIFSFNAIAEVESKYDKLITEVQANLPRAEIMISLLQAAVVGFDGDLMEAEIPPVVETQLLLQKAIHIAYFGAKATEEFEEAETKKSGKKKRK